MDPLINDSPQPNPQLIRSWIKRFLPNSEAIGLAIILVVGFLLIYLLSDLLMPVFASVVLAYLLEGLVCKAEKNTIPRLPAVLAVFSAFLAFLGYILFVLMPLLYQQTIQLSQRIPDMVARSQKEIMRLPEMYPKFISEYQVREVMLAIQNELLKYGQDLLSVSAASVVGLVTAMIYLILVPVLVFFFLKDKQRILSWISRFLPRDRLLSVRVWREVDGQIGNYVRGKFVEVFLLWAASYVTFSTMGLNYAMLLAVFMGLSVIIPYVGATLVTFPVLIVAYFQWGPTQEFVYILAAYCIIQAIDGVVLVPLLFSEAVNLHPVAIIVAILFFGGIWGFWGVFFAIPLATLVKAVLTAWPKMGDKIVERVY
ncbi:MAG: AI-2E family transporter [Gammaproteobacteria bacterium]